MRQTFTAATGGKSMAGLIARLNRYRAQVLTVTTRTVWRARAAGTEIRRIAALLPFFMLLALLPTGAMANCTFSGGTRTSAVTFNPPGTITIPFNTAVGTTIYTSPLIAPGVTSQIACTGTTNYGVINAAGATPGIGVRIYPTTVSGLGYSITHNDLVTYLFPYPCCQLAAGSYNASVSSSLQLVKTGPIVSGSVLPAGALGYWQFDNAQKVESFTLGNSVTILDPACSVNTTPINVTLPTVSPSALTAIGTVAGSTSFAISLTCAAGATLDIQMDFSGTASGITGVLTKTAGTSAGVGIQLLDHSFNPVTFGSTGKTVVGSTAGLSSIQYYARYYRTATPITAGSLTASATFTLTYQ